MSEHLTIRYQQRRQYKAALEVEIAHIKPRVPADWTLPIAAQKRILQGSRFIPSSTSKPSASANSLADPLLKSFRAVVQQAYTFPYKDTM